MFLLVVLVVTTFLSETATTIKPTGDEFGGSRAHELTNPHKEEIQSSSTDFLILYFSRHRMVGNW